MAKGLPKSYIKKWGISKRAWREYRKTHKKSKSRTTRKSKTKTKTKRKKSNPNRSVKRTGKRSLQTTVFKWLRIGALVAPAAVVATQPMKADQKLNEIFRLYTGVNIKHSMESNNIQFDWKRLAMGWAPFVAAIVTTYGIPKIAGMIRRI